MTVVRSKFAHWVQSAISTSSLSLCMETDACAKGGPLNSQQRFALLFTYATADPRVPGAQNAKAVARRFFRVGTALYCFCVSTFCYTLHHTHTVYSLCAWAAGALAGARQSKIPIHIHSFTFSFQVFATRPLSCRL